MELVMQPNGSNPGFAVSEKDNIKNNCGGLHGHAVHEVHHQHHENRGHHCDNHGDWRHLTGSQERFHLDINNNVRHEGDKNRDVMERFGLSQLNATKDSLKDILKDAADKNSAMQLFLAERFRDAEVEQQKQFAAVQLEAQKNKYEIAIEQQKIFAALQLQAEKNKCDLEKDISASEGKCAESACEIKRLVIEKGECCERLIREEKERDLRDKVEKLHEELLALRVRSTLAPQPVASACL